MKAIINQLMKQLLTGKNKPALGNRKY